DIYLEWTPVLAAVIGLAVWAIRPAALSAALPVIGLWISSRAISGWLNRAPRTVNRNIAAEDLALLRDSAERMCRFFSDWSTASTNWLIPDNIRDDGEVALLLSPTTLGLLLNA